MVQGGSCTHRDYLLIHNFSSIKIACLPSLAPAAVVVVPSASPFLTEIHMMRISVRNNLPSELAICVLPPLGIQQVSRSVAFEVYIYIYMYASSLFLLS